MKTQTSPQLLVKATIVFIGLLVLGVGMAVGAQFTDGAFEQSVLVSIGSAIVAGGLAFFLIEAFRYDRER